MSLVVYGRFLLKRSSSILFLSFFFERVQAEMTDAISFRFVICARSS